MSISFYQFQKKLTEIHRNAVLKRSAQSRDLCTSGADHSLDISILFNKYRDRVDLINIEKAVIELLMVYGLRISEVLSIIPSDVSSNGFITVRGKKHSKDRIVRSLNYSSLWQTSFKSIMPLSHYYSRYYFYRLFVKIGIYGRYGNNKYKSVTHFFRHEIVLSMRNSGIADNLISEFLGHKSADSLKYYTNEKK